MLLRFDPFRDLDRLANEMLGAARGPRMMPMDVYRSGDHYLVHFDLPGIDPGSVDVTVEEGTLTVRAERTLPSQEVQYLASERPTGTFSRQLVLGEGVDLDHVEASYHDGVLTLSIPVAERARPRRIEVTRAEGPRVLTGRVRESITESERAGG